MRPGHPRYPVLEVVFSCSHWLLVILQAGYITLILVFTILSLKALWTHNECFLDPLGNGTVSTSSSKEESPWKRGQRDLKITQENKHSKCRLSLPACSHLANVRLSTQSLENLDCINMFIKCQILVHKQISFLQEFLIDFNH